LCGRFSFAAVFHNQKGLPVGEEVSLGPRGPTAFGDRTGADTHTDPGACWCARRCSPGPAAGAPLGGNRLTAILTMRGRSNLVLSNPAAGTPLLAVRWRPPIPSLVSSPDEHPVRWIEYEGGVVGSRGQRGGGARRLGHTELQNRAPHPPPRRWGGMGGSYTRGAPGTTAGRPPRHTPPRRPCTCGWGGVRVPDPCPSRHFIRKETMGGGAEYGDGQNTHTGILIHNPHAHTYADAWFHPHPPCLPGGHTGDHLGCGRGGRPRGRMGGMDPPLCYKGGVHRRQEGEFLLRLSSLPLWRPPSSSSIPLLSTPPPAHAPAGILDPGADGDEAVLGPVPLPQPLAHKRPGAGPRRQPSMRTQRGGGLVPPPPPKGDGRRGMRGIRPTIKAGNV